MVASDEIVRARTAFRQPLPKPMDGPVVFFGGNYRRNRVGPNRFPTTPSDAMGGPIVLVDGSYRYHCVGPNCFPIAHSDAIGWAHCA